MKKIMAYLTKDKYASMFDIVVSCDSGADVIATYTSVEEATIQEVVYGLAFTRHPRDIKNGMIFIGGSKVPEAESILEEVIKVMNTIPEVLRASVVIDPSGAYTTSAAAVVKIMKAVQALNLENPKAVILAGTGPVGMRIGALLSKENIQTRLTSRSLERAKKACEDIKAKYGFEVEAVEASDEEGIRRAIDGCEIAITTGPPGVRLLPKKIWKSSKLKIMVDANAVEPYGIEGIKVNDDLTSRNDGLWIGALGIGNLKIKLHRKLIERAFQEREIFTLEKVYEIVKTL
ncbi:MAG: methylenetetrahydromethanopterin dehydrogenase [Candidatus Altiarchaeales archaeon]|nr:MAG: methylenetetrahydromethanopterin dehydrogenase [Candidatus Altiarchaeales archaeon]